MIGRVLGMLLFIELGMFLLCAGVSAGYGESDYKYFLYTCIINAVVGGLLLLYGRGAENKMSRRDGYCVVTLSWVFFTFFGMLPFYFSGSIDTIIQCLFRNHVRVYHYRSYYSRWYWIPFPRYAFLAKPDAVDRWFGDCVFHDCHSSYLYHGRSATLLCWIYGSDARPYPSENQCHGQVVVDNLSGIDSFGNCLIDVWGHELVDAICQSLPLRYGRIFYQAEQYILLEFSVYRICGGYLYDCFQYQLLFVSDVFEKEKSVVYSKMKSYTGFWRQWVSWLFLSRWRSSFKIIMTGNWLSGKHCSRCLRCILPAVCYGWL